MNKKSIITLIGAILIIIILGAIVFVIINKTGKEETEKTNRTKTSEVYDKIEQSNKIKLVRTVDKNNQITTIIEGEKAYKEITKNGITTRYIVKDGNTYFIDDINKKYYEYQNNTTILNEIKNELEQINNTSNIIGKEKIDGKSYRYEEFSNNKFFLINDNLVNSSSDFKTRFYFNDNNLVYIKIIVNKKEEVQKVDLSYSDINDSYFTIPNDYKKS